VEKEHTLPNGEIIWMTSVGDNPNKPWQVMSIATDGEVRWCKDFATQDEAEREYVRFD
jgi:hypothetical protein